MPNLFIIAGCNGAGKTTASFNILPEILECKEFVNADIIAAGLSPFQPETVAIAAGRLMLQRIENHIIDKIDFAFETTLSAKTYLKFIQSARARGYRVNLIFLKLENPKLAQERVLTRVSKGGHNIEPLVICRRFKRGLENLENYLKISDTATIYESSGLELIEIAKQSENKLIVINQNLWEKIYA